MPVGRTKDTHCVWLDKYEASLCSQGRETPRKSALGVDTPNCWRKATRSLGGASVIEVGGIQQRRR